MEDRFGLELKLEKQQNVSQQIAVDPTPEKAVSDYFQAKFEKNVLVQKKPEWDAPRITPSTELVMAKRELLKTDRNLEWQRDVQSNRREEMDKEWKDLLDKELSLREAILKFNKFVKENHEKRERAERKIKEEKEFQNLRDREIEELQDKVDYMKSMKDEMERHVKEYRMYENFLLQVLSTSSEMHSSYDILNRYETLASARIELAARQERDLSALETARTEMIKLTEEKSEIMMGLNTELAQLQIRYDRAKAMSLRWETALTRIKNISAEKALELDQVRHKDFEIRFLDQDIPDNHFSAHSSLQNPPPKKVVKSNFFPFNLPLKSKSLRFSVKTCCWNLYTAMCARKNVEVSVDPDNIEEQLVFIKRSIQELKRILRIVQKKAAKEALTTKPRQSEASS